VRGASIVQISFSCLVDLSSDVYRLCSSLHGLDTFWARGLSWINKETTTTTESFVQRHCKVLAVVIEIRERNQIKAVEADCYVQATIPSFVSSLTLCVYVCMYTYIYVHVFMYTYMYIYESICIFQQGMHASTGIVEHHACAGVYVRQLLWTSAYTFASRSL